MWVWLLIGIAVLIILFYRSTRENLTNQQSVGKRNEQPIYGPTALPPVDPPVDGTSTGGAKPGKTTGGPYPEIFGPDATPQIGAGSLAGEESKTPPVSDVAPASASEAKPSQSQSKPEATLKRPLKPIDDGSRKLNPFLTDAFPYEGPPQPFLTDFSKILH
jgi:hypothetical protein